MELNELLDYSLSELGRGGADRKHPFRFVTLSTVTADGFPDARMVVMRKFDSQNLQLKIYTDERSCKVAQLEEQPIARLLFWNPRKRLQVKVKAHFTKVTGKDALSIYKQLPEQGISSYNTLQAPSIPVDTLSEAHQWKSPADGEHFVILNASVLEIEALKLEDREHLRAIYQFNDEGELLLSQWLVP